MHASVRDERYQDVLASLIDNADASLQQWLASNNALDVSMSYLMRNDTDRASGAVTRAIAHIVDAWSSLSPLASESRKSILSSIQPVVEMHEFLQLSRRVAQVEASGGRGAGELVHAVNSCLHMWTNRCGCCWPVDTVVCRVVISLLQVSVVGSGRPGAVGQRDIRS